MAYERRVDLMNESFFPRDSLYAQKKNPKESITTDVRRVEQTNDEIIEFVTKEMSGTLGDVHDPEVN
jgi:S-adenosylmethionine:diacylglycerol 3-amino-3-carboxypropyl transferase